MTYIRIVCDASYDEELCFSGYAGFINIKKIPSKERNVSADDQTITYGGVKAEQKSSQESETFAILAGLRQLCQREVTGIDVNLVNSTIDIYSDCRGTQERFQRFDLSLMHENDQEFFYIKEIYDLLERYQCRLKVNYVSAHTPEHQATKIQKLNNLADKRARDIRVRAIDLMLRPELDKNSREQVAILLPEFSIGNAENKAWRQLAKHLVEKGTFIHLYIEGDPVKHSFIAALEHFAPVQQTNTADIFKIFTYTPDFLKDSLNKNELTLLRYHMKKRNLIPNVQLTNTEVHNRAAIASRLIFGELSEKATNLHRFGREKAPVDAVYDLMERLEPCDKGVPNSVQGWANTFLNYIDIPLARGLFEVFNHEGLSTKCELPIRDSSLQNTELADKDYTDIIPHAEERLLTAFTEIYHNNLVSLNSRELSYKELTQLFIHEYREQVSIGTLIDPPICGVLDPLKTVFFVLKQSDYFLLCAPRPV